MSEGFIILSVLFMIVTIHFLVRKFALRIDENYSNDAEERRKAIFVLFMSVAMFFFLMAWILIVATQ